VRGFKVWGQLVSGVEVDTVDLMSAAKVLASASVESQTASSAVGGCTNGLRAPAVHAGYPGGLSVMLAAQALGQSYAAACTDLSESIVALGQAVTGAATVYEKIESDSVYRFGAPAMTPAAGVPELVPPVSTVSVYAKLLGAI